jgi:elongation factor Ts
MSTEITASLVNTLREKTGAGMMDCKKALVEANGNMEEAETILRKKGVASAAKKAGRAANQGLVESYIHLGGKIGVLVEVNCETDFVAKTPDFQALCKDLCMQVAAAAPLYVSRDQVPEEDLAKEREIAASQVAGKPPAAVQKIVEGKLEKYFQTICLMDQPFVKNPDVAVKDLLTERIAKLGENMLVRRFARFQLGA